MEKDVTNIKILFSVVVFLFIIGLVIFIFTLFGGSIYDATLGTTEGD
ncbi:unnamed protein product, partial [marine sediment metagenome]